MVGFQTKMKYGAQTDVIRMIPGLEKAEFARLGGIHRNTFINSPKLLDGQLRLKERPQVRFAGQITGVEGYVESAASGLIAGRFAAAQRKGEVLAPPPPTTAHGALISHITGGHLSVTSGDGGARSFQPMNINFGLLPPIEAPTRDEEGRRIKGKAKGLARKQAMARRALDDFSHWLATAGGGDGQVTSTNSIRLLEGSNT
jgi:methylenetetrahydrofolate--tRNA-(uracil-5-)-methyltransferase